MPGTECTVCILLSHSLPNWRGDTVSIPGLQLRKLQLREWSGSCIPGSLNGQGSQYLSPALSRVQDMLLCGCLLPFGQPLPEQRWPLGDTFLHWEPLSSPALCLKQFQNFGAISGFCLLGLTLQPPSLTTRSAFLI